MVLRRVQFFLKGIASDSMLKRILLFLGFFALAAFVYRNGLRIPYFYDDYEHVFINPASEIFHSFFQANGFAHFYRPIERSVLALSQAVWGWDTLPIRLFHLLLHAAGAMLVFHSLRTWKVSNICAFSGAALKIVSQLCVYAVASNDTQSQLEGALFSAFSLWLLYRYFAGDNNNSWKYALSILTFFLALLSKETSAGLLLGIPFLIFSLEHHSGNFQKRIQKTFLLFLPYGICFLIYWLIRISAGGSVPVVGSGSYSFHAGINLLKNPGLFIIQELLPVSSMSVAEALQNKEYLPLVLMILFTGIFALLFGYGLRRSPRRKVIGGICLLMILSWFPALFLGSISELYPYNSIIYLGALFGIAAEYYWLGISGRSKVLGIGTCTIFLAALISHSIAVDKKTSGMKTLGDRAEIFLPQIISLEKTLPLNTVMYLVNPKDSSFEYTQFAMHGFHVLAGCDSLVRFYAHRPDFQYFIGDSAECSESMKYYPGIAFTYDRETLRIYPKRHDSGESFSK